MKKFLFDEAGLQSLLQTLYALNDVDLAKEVNALEADFSGWIRQHFTLTEKQESFLSKMNQSVLKFLTYQCSYAGENRLPVVLEKGGKSSKDSGEEGDKLFEPKSKLQASTDTSGNFRAGGSLVIAVSYNQA